MQNLLSTIRKCVRQIHLKEVSTIEQGKIIEETHTHNAIVSNWH